MIYPRKIISKSEVKRCLLCQGALKKIECNQNLQSCFPIIIFIINTIAKAKTIEKCEGKKKIKKITSCQIISQFGSWSVISSFALSFFPLSSQHKTLQNIAIVKSEVKEK